MPTKSSLTPAGADALLLVTAAIWGFAFVAQRASMEFVGPFAFNGIRFALGALALSPLLFIGRQPRAGVGAAASANDGYTGGKNLLLWGGLGAGLLLFAGASLQQAGLVHTGAGNAGFITGLYVVIVPVLGLALGQRTSAGTWLGVALATVGLYLLSVTDGLVIGAGDVLVLVGAFFWAGHVVALGWLSPRLDTVRLAIFQFSVCAALSLAVSALTERTTAEGLEGAVPAILYGGLASVGVAYTLQVHAQGRAHPAHAAIILSLEAVFAAVGGWLILHEGFTARALAGCGLMLAGILVSQLWTARRPTRRAGSGTAAGASGNP